MLPLLTPWERVALAFRLLFGGCVAVRSDPDRWADGTLVRRVEVLTQVRSR